MSELDNKVATINPLLDIDTFTGKKSTSMKPALIFFGVVGTPTVFYFARLFGIVPIWVFITFITILSFITALYTFGRQTARVYYYKRQIHDVYASVYDMMDIEEVFKDGMIKFNKGKIAYMIVCENKEVEDPLQRAQRIKVLHNSIGAFYDFDIRVYNVSKEDSLYSRYEGTKLFGDNEIKKEFMKIIDFNRSLIKNNSLLTMTVYIIFDDLSSQEDLYAFSHALCKRAEASVYKNMYVADQEQVIKVLSIDTDTYVSIEDMITEKYSGQEYFGSKVEGFTRPGEEVTTTSMDDGVEKGFMVNE
jgi:hypothetical protein